MLAIILLLCAVGHYTPVFGGFLHSSSSSVGVPVPVPVGIPVSVPGPVEVQANVAIPAVYSGSSAHPYSVALAYAAPQLTTTMLKYAPTYVAPNPVIKYSLGAPTTTTITTYSGLASLSPHFLNRLAPPLHNSPAPPLTSFRLHTTRLPTPFYAVPPQLTYASPSAW